MNFIRRVVSRLKSSCDPKLGPRDEGRELRDAHYIMPRRLDCRLWGGHCALAQLAPLGRERERKCGRGRLRGVAFVRRVRADRPHGSARLATLGAAVSRAAKKAA